MADKWYNADGLAIRYGTAEGLAAPGAREMGGSGSGEHVLRIPYSITGGILSVPEFTTDRDNDGTDDGFSTGDVYIPAGAGIISCDVLVRVAHVGAVGVYNIGTYQEDGTVIDQDGLMTSTEGVVANFDKIGGA